MSCVGVSNPSIFSHPHMNFPFDSMCQPYYVRMTAFGSLFSKVWHTFQHNNNTIWRDPILTKRLLFAQDKPHYWMFTHTPYLPCPGQRASLQPGLQHASFSLPCPVVLGTLSDYLQIRGGHPHYHTHLVPASSHRVVEHLLYESHRLFWWHCIGDNTIDPCFSRTCLVLWIRSVDLMQLGTHT